MRGSSTPRYRGPGAFLEAGGSRQDRDDSVCMSTINKHARLLLEAGAYHRESPILQRLNYAAPSQVVCLAQKGPQLTLSSRSLMVFCVSAITFLACSYTSTPGPPSSTDILTLSCVIRTRAIRGLWAISSRVRRVCIPLQRRVRLTEDLRGRRHREAHCQVHRLHEHGYSQKDVVLQ
jgi:hypothetical protein